jgi:nucleotidyltransferase substrate binding protein (TIGR01987 family)
MERSKKLNAKIELMKKVTSDTHHAVHRDISNITDEEILDTLKNGQLQKFEYTLELIWKTLKSFLKEEKGIIVQGSKDTFREIAPFIELSPDMISNILKIIDDRNSLAHEYEEFIMSNIYPKLKGYLDLLVKVVTKF